jgi:hypothetical protein
MNLKNTKLDFQSEHLTIDWITFYFQCTLESEKIQTISKYLLDELGFNISIRKPNQDNQDIKVQKVLLYKLNTSLSASLIPWLGSYWTGVSLIFSGKNGHFFKLFFFLRIIEKNSIINLKIIKLGKMTKQFNI